MKEINTLITVLGWEDRFIEGNVILIEKFKIKHIILIIFKDYLYMKNMQKHRNTLEEKASDLNIKVTNLELIYSDSVKNWKILDKFFNSRIFKQTILLNTTTFPRETIWAFLFFLKNQTNKIYYTYFKPLKYDNEWLTKNHKNPRLLFKHSGVFKLNNEIALFIVTGFDENRMQLLIDYYEPKSIVIFNQTGTQFDNKKRNNINNIDYSLNIDNEDIDNYNVNNSTELIYEKIKEYKKYNIILVAQGPKLSALSTYKSFLLSKGEIALSYVPVKDFNLKYSLGTNKDFIFGQLDLKNII